MLYKIKQHNLLHYISTLCLFDALYYVHIWIVSQGFRQVCDEETDLDWSGQKWQLIFLKYEAEKHKCTIMTKNLTDN